MLYVNVDDYRRRARLLLPHSIFDFIDGAAGDESTMKANRHGFERITFRPRPLVDVSQRDQTTTVLGRRVNTPILLGPAGSTRLAHRDGELAMARAARRLGTVYALSTTSNFSLEEVADAGRGAPLWFQIYLWKDLKVVADLVARAEKAGFYALCCTIDVPVSGVKDRDLRNGLTIPPRITAGNAFDIARRPRWLWDYITGPPITFQNLMPYGFDMGGGVMKLSTFMRDKLNNPAITWEDLRWLRGLWSGPLVVKGVLTADAAKEAFSVGADAVVVSNHGGRQLAGNPASIDVLPEILDVAGEKEVYVDGGVRRGFDVVKAIALGARACLIARPYHWALAVGGEDGVVEMVQMLEREVDNVLAQVGRPCLYDLDSSAVVVSRF